MTIENPNGVIGFLVMLVIVGTLIAFLFPSDDDVS